MINRLKAQSAPLVWGAVLVAATLAGSLFASCLMPFVALAVMAAATLSPRRALTVVAAAWAANQALAITVQHIPLTAFSLGCGAAQGVAALAATALALGLRPASPRRLPLAFALAFALYETLLFAWAAIVGGLDTFAPAIVALVALNEVLWLAALVAARALLAWRAPHGFAPAPQPG